MALNVAALASGIRRVFEAQEDDVAQIARKVAKAYFDYAKLAQAPPGTPVVLKGNELPVLSQALLPVMRGQFPAPQAAQAIGNAVVAFWMAPPVMTAAGGAVTVVVPQGGMAKMASVRTQSVQQAAVFMAQAMDMITRTAFVTHSPPLPSGPLF